MYDPNIAYFYVSAILDKNTCQVCKEINGLHILNDKSQLERLKNYENGVKTCTSPHGCRCILVGVYKEEIGSDKIVAELEKAGGVLPKSYFEEKERKRLKQSEILKKRNDLAYELYHRGRKLEKINIAEAIKIYTSIIEDLQDIGPTYFLPAFLRLSLCYEREKKYEECLETIRMGLVENNKFMFHCFTQGDMTSLLKRFDRYKQKYPHYKKQLPKVFNFGKWSNVLYKFGFDNSDWEETSASLTKKFGRRPSLNDVAWALFNKAIINSKNPRRLHELYNYMANFLEEEGRKGSEKLRNLAKKYKT
jgi:tetratricopeptide (TPR) repeat protein